MDQHEMAENNEFARNAALEELLTELNDLLSQAEQSVVQRYQQPAMSPVIIVGCPRSGTTLLLQWLANSGQFTYPSNLISRFYRAPYIGARIQQMLTDPRFAFRKEMYGIQTGWNDNFQSDLGKTRGLLAPNEFWYFWRRFFPYREIQYLSEQELAAVDTKTFTSELAALEAIFKKPLALKGLIANWNLPFLAAVLEKAIFLYIKRHPFFTIQSLLRARLKFFGTLNEWYSLKPREFDDLKRLDPYHQVAGQVYYTNQAIQQGLRIIKSSRWIEVGYEYFCSNPQAVWRMLEDRFREHGYEGNLNYDGPKWFDARNCVFVSPKEQEAIIAAYWELFQIDISPTTELMGSHHLHVAV